MDKLNNETMQAVGMLPVHGPAGEKPEKRIKPSTATTDHQKKPLGQRRAKRPFSLKLEKPDSDISKKMKCAFLGELKAKIAFCDCHSECNKIIGTDHHLFPIDGNGIRTFAHQIPRTNEAVISFWQLIKSQGIKKVVSLQTHGWYPSYLPDPVTADAVKNLSDGTAVKILEVTDLKKEFGGENVKSVKVEIIYSDNTEIILDVEQVFNWKDGGVLPIDQIKKVVDMLPDEHCQVHCEGGLGRTGTLIVLKQLSRDKQITKDNMLEKIAEVIARSRLQRGDCKFVQTDVQLQLIWEYVLNELICYSN